MARVAAPGRGEPDAGGGVTKGEAGNDPVVRGAEARSASRADIAHANRCADRIRAMWRGMGLDVEVFVNNQGEIISGFSRDFKSALAAQDSAPAPMRRDQDSVGKVRAAVLRASRYGVTAAGICAATGLADHQVRHALRALTHRKTIEVINPDKRPQLYRRRQP